MAYMIIPDTRLGRYFGIAGHFAGVPAYQIANDFQHALNRLSAALSDFRYPEGSVHGARSEPAETIDARAMIATAKAIRGPTEKTVPARTDLYEQVLMTIHRLEAVRTARDHHLA